MAKINEHHPDYRYPKWTLEVTGQMHRLLTVVQNTRPSPEQYARLTNFVHSLVAEWNRMRRELDTGAVSAGSKGSTQTKKERRR